MLVANLNSTGSTNWYFYAKAPYTIRIKSPDVYQLLLSGALNSSNFASPIVSTLEFQTCAGIIAKTTKIIDQQPYEFYQCTSSSYVNVFMLSGYWYPQGYASFVLYLQDYYVNNLSNAAGGLPWISSLPFVKYDLKSHDFVLQFDGSGNISMSIDGVQVFFTSTKLPPPDLVNLAVGTSEVNVGAITLMDFAWTVDAAQYVDLSAIINSIMIAVAAIGVVSFLVYAIRSGLLQRALQRIGQGLRDIGQQIKEKIEEVKQIVEEKL